MAESPTIEQVKIERPDVQKLVDDNEANLSIDDYIAKALAEVKRMIEDVKGIRWSMVYNETDDRYFLNADGEAQNKDRIENIIILLTISKIFQDYSNGVVDSRWWDLHLAYQDRYDKSVKDMKISVDWDESGEIVDGEDEQTTQRFMGR